MSASAHVDKMGSRRRFDSSGGRTVLPEAANGKSYMESVYSFIHDLSQAYTQSAPVEEKEAITWARFFTYSDANGYEEVGLSQNSPVILILGYSSGIQMWNLLPTGEAQEAFSLREGPVKTACLLSPPPPSNMVDGLQTARPLIAICIATDSKQLYANVSVRSLRSGDQVKKLQFPTDILHMESGPAPLFLVTIKDSLHGFDTRTLTKIFVINGCYNGSGYNPNPVAIGRRWLAYAPSTLMSGCQSQGGVAGDGAHSYMSSVISAAKTIGKGIFQFSDTVNWLAAKSNLSSSTPSANDESASSTGSRERIWGSRKSSGALGLAERGSELVHGLVTILDLNKLLSAQNKDEDSDHSDRGGALEIASEPQASYVIAHFIAHMGQAISCMTFDPTCRMLATADAVGHAFHVFSIYPHPGGSPMGAVHHLYTLRRGETSAQVQELRFSWDRRWLVASTLRGTCHVFPVAPYGGSPCVRTHTSDKLVNRSSRFHKSAGLDEIEYSEPHIAPVHRPMVDNSAPLPQGVLGWHTQHRSSRAPSSANPRLPPLPHPVVVNALAHIRLAPVVPNVLPGQNAFMMSSGDAGNTSSQRGADIVIASRFLRVDNDQERPRVQAGSSAKGPASQQRGGRQRLLIASSCGLLTEYLLEPRPQHTLQKVSDDSPVELLATPCVCWPLQRSPSWGLVSLSLTPRNAILAADDRCRRHHESTRLRHKPAHRDAHCPLNSSSPSPNGFVSIPLAGDESASPTPLGGGKGVRSEQPKAREARGKQSRQPSAPGGAVPLTNSSKGRKAPPTAPRNPRGTHFDQAPPKAEKMRRNGDEISEEREPSKKSAELASKVELSRSASEDDWPSQIEMNTHEGPARRLWMGPQFHFKPLQSTGNTHVLSSLSSALLSHQQHLEDSLYDNGPSPGDAHAGDLQDDELDVDSLPIHSSRSEPVPTPAPRYGGNLDDTSSATAGCCSSLSRLTIEAGSGNFDRVSNMLEVNSYGSLEERRGGRQVEDKLKERIADAMVEFNRGVPKTKIAHPGAAPEFTAPPSMTRVRTMSDGNEFESLKLIPEQFQFTENH